MLADLFRLRHLVIQFDPVNACNLRCTMCYYGNPDYTKRKRQRQYRFTEDELQKLAKEFFPLALTLNVGAAAEPTVHKNYIDLILLAKRYKVPSVSLTTNGQKITAKEVKQLVAAGLDEIILSVHGVTAQTYEHFMQNANFDKFVALLNQLKSEKQEQGREKPEIRLNYTANPSNFREIRDLMDQFSKFNISTIQIRPVVDIPDAPYEWEDFTPYFQEYIEILESLEADCKAKNIRLLATYTDPTLKTKTRRDNPRASILNYVLRPIKPGQVWKKNLDWPTESYRSFCKRTRFRRELLKQVLSLGRSSTQALNKKADIYLTYDVKD